jgi:C-terminal processing protease CtpA/Prc
LGGNRDPVEQISKSPDSENEEVEPENTNFGFDAIDQLDGGVGYLKLSEFADTEYGGVAAVAAMQQLVDSKSLIFDLRRNGGDNPKMVQLLTTYLLGHEPLHLNDFYMRETDALDQFWILP